jgi:glutathione S-transferase
MITLYTFGPYFGLPDASPFVIKAALLLKFAEIQYKIAIGGFRKAPNGKLPYIKDDGAIIADSSLIRRHIEAKYGVDFDQGLDAAARGTAWAVEKMCDEHFYWAIVHFRWMDAGNFAKGPAEFFKTVPAPLRPMVQRIARRKVRGYLHGHGLGRHQRANIEAFAIRDLEAIAAILGDKPFLLGDAPCSGDASVFAAVCSSLCPIFESPIRARAAAMPTLVAYRDRVMQAYFPEA